jgi:hypothetical protein
MDQSLAFQHFQNLDYPALNIPLIPRLPGGDGFDQFLVGLSTGKKGVVNEIAGRHEIKSGTPVIIEQQPKDFPAHLDPFLQAIDLPRFHGATLSRLPVPQSSSRAVF